MIESVENTQDILRVYLAAFLAPASVRFGVGEIQAFGHLVSPDNTPVVVEFYTRYTDEGYEAPVPRELCAEARGLSTSLEEATNTFSYSVGSLGMYIAFAANAALGEFRLDVGLDITPRQPVRAFLQAAPSRDYGTPRWWARRSPTAAIETILLAVSEHPERDRLDRAVGQYEQALLHWCDGSELLALSYLFRGVDTLALATLHTHCARNGITEKDFGRSWESAWDKIAPERRPGVLLSLARRKLIFQGDDACHQRAREIRGGFEHGHREFASAIPAAREVLHLTAGYLRAAILDIAGIDLQTQRLLLSPQYGEPLQAQQLTEQVRGYLITPHEQLAEHGDSYPWAEWGPTLRNLRIDDSGGYVPDLHPPQDLVLHAASDVSLASELQYAAWEPKPRQR